MKSSRLFRPALFLAALLLCLSAAPAVHSQVINGGFETGDLTGWTVVDPDGYIAIGSDPAFAHSGNYHLNLGSGPALGSLSQDLSTAAGSTYSLSFWLANDSSVPPNEFDVFWDGNLVFSLTNVAVFPYTNYSIPNLVASGSSTTLEFRNRNDADFFRLDDIQVDVVPEMSTLPLVLLGLGLVSLGRVKIRARAQDFCLTK
ncbi:MAG: hypothetical protein ACR2HH_09635 [Chthoniobacterales bacterium]